MYIYRNDHIVNVDIKIDNDKLEKIIYNLKNNINNSNEYKQIYIRFISFIEEIEKFGFKHNGLLEKLSIYKEYERYTDNANIYLNKKLNQYKNITNNQMEKIIENLPDKFFAGLYGNLFQNDLLDIIDCFKIEDKGSFRLDIHEILSNSIEKSDKETLSKWKDMYFTSIKNTNIIKLLNIKDSAQKIFIKNKEE